MTVQRASLCIKPGKLFWENKCLSGTLIGLINAPAGRPLGAYDLGVANPGALVTLMISKVVICELADFKSILYGSCIERSCFLVFVLDLVLRIVVLRFAWTPAWAFGFIMPPRMTTRSASPATATPRGRRTGGRTGRGGGRTRGRSSDQGNGGIDGQSGQAGSQVGGQGSEVNDGVDGVPNVEN
ncbi:hypothetical protein Tco_0339739 [Tanacetum coccineum]